MTYLAGAVGYALAPLAAGRLPETTPRGLSGLMSHMTTAWLGSIPLLALVALVGAVMRSMEGTIGLGLVLLLLAVALNSALGSAGWALPTAFMFPPPSAFPSAQLPAAIGMTVLSPEQLRALQSGHRRAVDAPELTEREQEVLAALCQGLSNAEIASQLFFSESSVKAHLSAIMDKLDAHTRVKVVLRARNLGLA